MKQKILFYVLLFSLLINLYLVVDYGRRLTHTQAKLEAEVAKTAQLQDSINVIQKKLNSARLTSE